MSHSVVIESANFSKFVDRAVPHLALANGFWLFGDSFDASKVNLAPVGGPDLTPNGTIAYGPGYVEFTGVGSYFGTGLTVTGDHTLIVVHTATTPSTYDVMISGGAFDRLGHIAKTTARNGGAYGGVATPAHAPGASYGFMASTMPADNSASKIYTTPNAGNLIETVGGTLGAALPIANVTIGPEVAAYGTVGTHRQAAAMVFDTRLTLEQITDIYDYFRFKMPTRGIAVF